MKFHTAFILFFLAINFSCTQQAKINNSDSQITDSTAHTKEMNTHKQKVVLMVNTKKETADWKEYQLVDALLTNYYSISNAEALSNAKELSNLVTKLKENNRPEKLKSPAINSRINILHNECLRLNDMANIPAITPIEVSSSVKKIIEAYAGLNAKLNSIFAVKEIEKELELDPDFLNILKDTTNKSLWDVNNTKEKPATQKPKKFNKNSTIKEKKSSFQ